MLRRRLSWSLVLLAAGLAIALALRPRPVEVDLSPVTRGPFTVTVDDEGETRVQELFVISAPLGGRLERVSLEPGDPIKRGQVIAEIMPAEPALLDSRTGAELQARANAADAALDRAESLLAAALAEEELAQRYFDRDAARLAKGSISPPTLEDTRHALRIASANVSTAQSSVKVAQFERDQAHAVIVHSQPDPGPAPSEVARFTIHSPIDGVVLRRFHESSTILSSGEPILEIGDPTQLEIRVDVLSQDAVRIRPGQPILVKHWGGEEPLAGWVRRVEPAAFTKISALGVEEKRVWVYGSFSNQLPPGTLSHAAPPEFDGQTAPAPPPSLGDSYRLEAKIVVYESPDSLQLPAGALFRYGREEGASWAVFRVDDEGRAQLAVVEIGQRNDRAVEVMSGLVEGDRVILHPSDKVTPLQPVTQRAGRR
jgi:HlyD family secretion protein